VGNRRGLTHPGLPTGKKARRQRTLCRHGLGNGMAMLLPYNQGWEHGPRDFFANSAATDPAYIVGLGVEGKFNGAALHVGNAEKFFCDVAGELPVLKLNGRTELPPSDALLSPLNASVGNAVRPGAEAVGYTLDVGSRQAEDSAQFRTVPADAQGFGMPIIFWAYAPGSAVAAAGGHDSHDAVDYEAWVAAELGADIVKVNFPDPTATSGVKAPYDREVSTQRALDSVVASAGRALMVFSGGEKATDDAVPTRTQQAMDVGATGVTCGRNIWQRDHDQSLRFAARLADILGRYPSSPGTLG
jgi:class I fructose-bisphosphate aldolase